MAGCLCTPWQLECVWATSGWSLSLVLSLSVSHRPQYPVYLRVTDCATECVTLSLASYMGGGKVCGFHRERDRQIHSPFLPPAPSPCSPLLCDSSLESVYVCICLTLGLWGCGGGGTHWLSHSYVRIRQIHLHFLTVTHSIFRWEEGILVVCLEVNDTTQRRWDHFCKCGVWDEVRKDFSFAEAYKQVIKVD